MTELETKMAECLLSILDTLKLADNDNLDMSDETLSQMMFRKMKASDVDLNELLGFTHLKPINKVDYISGNKFYTLYMENLITNISENIDADVTYKMEFGKNGIYSISRTSSWGYRLYVNEKPSRCIIPLEVVENGSDDGVQNEELTELLIDMLKIMV